jgi:hypothetical protein
MNTNQSITILVSYISVNLFSHVLRQERGREENVTSVIETKQVQYWGIPDRIKQLKSRA